MYSYTVQSDNSSIILKQTNLNYILDKLRSCQLDISSLVEPFSLFYNLNVFSM